jgi:hypothetical protein
MTPGEPHRAPHDVEGGGIPAAVLVRDAWWSDLVALPMLIAMATIWFGAGTIPSGWLVLGGVVALVVLPISTRWLGPRRHRAEGKLAIDGESLKWNGEPWIARRKIRQVDWREDPERGAVVHVRLASGFDAAIAVADADAARAVVKALGFGASERTAAFTSMSPAFSLPSVARAAIALAAFLAPAALLLSAISQRSQHLLFASAATMVAAIVSLVVWLGVRTRIVVGTDGVATRWLGRRRFIPFADVDRIRADEQREFDAAYRAIAIVARDGTRHRIVVGPVSDDPATRDVLLERMRDALDSRRHDDSAADAASLERRDREPSAWLRALRARGAGADADARTAPMSIDRLWALVEDASVAPQARAAAAVALASDGAPDARQRIRIAAYATASPALRSTLELAAAEHADDEALGEALAALEDQARSVTRRR